MKSGLRISLLCHDRERKKEVHHAGKTMREPTLYVSSRTGEGILFVELPRGKNRRSLFLCPYGVRKYASIGEPSQCPLGHNRRRCEAQAVA
jgi:hypothetical protein